MTAAAAPVRASVGAVLRGAVVWATLSSCGGGAGAASPADALRDAAPLPLATTRLPASADECAVWRREASFAKSVEAHDADAFVEHLHAGAVFNAGDAAAARGRDAVVAAWAGIVDGRDVALRWRPGVVQIGGAADVAVSKGPFVLAARRDGQAKTSVGFFQSVWLREADGRWRILFDAGASTPRPVADRAAADAWVAAQPMSDCAAG